MTASTHLPMKQYFAGITQIPLLSREEERGLGRHIQAGDEGARERLIVANLRLVAKIAHQFSYNGIAVDDLIEEGNLGLMEAVDRFDPENGAKFSTYAAWWIKHMIRRAIHNNSRTVRLPSSVYEKANCINRVMEQIQNESGREPTAAEIADCVGIPEESINKVRSVMQPACPLDAPVGEEGNATAGDLLPDESAPAPDQTAGCRDALTKAMGLLSKLSERERKIVELRFGLARKSHREKTLGVANS
jgi:RNA polymerase primary sigma factor